MTSDTFRSHRVPPIDLVLHALQDALSKSTCEAVASGLHDQATRSAGLACALTRAINPGALASSWAAEGDADIAGAHLARRLVNPGAEDGDLRPVSNAEGRALETAVARRLADTACSLAITGDKEDAEHARALWEASATLAVLLPPYTGDTLRAAADIVTAINGPSTKSSSNADKERLRQCAIDIAAIVGLDWEEGDNTIGTLQVAIATIAGWAKPMRRIAEDPADSLRRLKSDAAEVRKPAPRILQSADDAPCGSLSQVMHRHERVVMRLLNGRGWGMGEKACSGLVEGWTWSANAAKDFPARLIAEGLTEPECRHLSGLSAADAIAWCEQRSRDAATAIADRRLKALMQADERDSMAREHLGAGDTETTVDAAKRVAKERDDLLRRDPCLTCREDRRKAVAELEEANRQHAIAINAAEQAVAMAHKERDAATALADQRLDAITAVDKQVAGWGEKYQRASRERDLALEESAGLRKAAASSYSFDMKPGDDRWRGLMSGPIHGGRWTLETFDGLLRMRWPNGVVEALVEPRIPDSRYGGLQVPDSRP